MKDIQRAFIKLAVNREVLRFGLFTLKSGRKSPYFFNAGLFQDGLALSALVCVMPKRFNAPKSNTM